MLRIATVLEDRAGNSVQRPFEVDLTADFVDCTDDVAELERAGVDVARNLYGEAGQGLADDGVGYAIGG